MMLKVGCLRVEDTILSNNS